MQLPRQSEDPVKPKKIRSTDDFGITGSTVYFFLTYVTDARTYPFLDLPDNGAANS